MIRLLHTATEAIALRMLARDGIATIWQLQVAGRPLRTALAFADAAERQWLQQRDQHGSVGIVEFNGRHREGTKRRYVRCSIVYGHYHTVGLLAEAGRA